MSKRKSKKRRFSNNQLVVFRFGDRNMVGNIISTKPIGRRFVYDVLAENEKIYTDLDVDLEMNECIDTYLTKLYYAKYGIVADIPEILPENNMPLLNKLAEKLFEDAEEEIETESIFIDEEPLYVDEDLDPNY